MPASFLRSPFEDHVALVCVIREPSRPSFLFLLIANEPDLTRKVPCILGIEALIAAGIFDREAIEAIPSDLLHVGPKRLVDTLVDTLQIE